LTVSSNIPIEEYTGNGSIDRFDWDWDMIADSAINVLVDGELADGWSLQGKSVIFDVAPADGLCSLWTLSCKQDRTICRQGNNDCSGKGG